MQTTRQLRCEQCGHESDPQYRFCGMCGSRLPTSQTVSARKDNPPLAAEEKERSRPVSGPSFLGLADEPTDRITYLLEDEPGTSHGARLFVIILLLAGFAFAGWHWRSMLRGWAMQAMQRTAKTQPQQSQDASYKTAPISTSGSEVAGSVPNATTITETPPGSAANQAPAVPPQAAPGQTSSNPTAAAQGAPGQNAPGGGTATPSAPATGAQAGSNPPGQSQGSSAATGGTATQQSSGQGAASQQPVANSAAASPAGAAAAKSTTPAEKQGTGSDNSAVSDQSATAKKSSSPAGAAQVQPEAPETPDQGLEAEGEKYLYGTGVPADCDRAQKDLLTAGEHGNPKAASVLGTMYATGHCVTRDLPLSYLWFAKALRKDPNNVRVENDLLMVWSQMTPQEREVAVQRK